MSVKNHQMPATMRVDTALEFETPKMNDKINSTDSAEICDGNKILHPNHRKTELVHDTSHALEGKEKKHCKHI